MEKTKKKNGFVCLLMLVAMCCLSFGLVACGTQTYEITTSINGAVETTKYAEGSSATITAPGVEGLTFSYWAYGESQITDNPYTFTVSSSTAGTYEAVYVVAEMEVNFVVDGFTDETETVTYGHSIGSSTTWQNTDTDKICGWFYDEALTQAVSEDDVITADTTLYTYTATTEYLTFKENKNEEEEVISYSVTGATSATALNEKQLVIPQTYDSLPVTSVAIINSTLKEEIDTEETEATEYDEEYFDDGSFVDAMADDTISSYSYTGSVKTIVLGANVTEISDYAFYCISSATFINIPKTVTKIGAYAFYFCSGLTEISLPEGLTEISEYTFYNATSISEVVVPEGVTKVGFRAFYNCTSLASLTLPETLTYIDLYAFANIAISSLVLPESVDSIMNYAFSGCENLANLTMPEQMSTLNSYAFNGCTSLKNILLPEGLTYIGNCLFEGCTALQASATEGNVSYLASRNNTYYMAWKATSTDITEATLNENTVVLTDTFYKCASLASIELTSKIEVLGTFAFGGCSSLEEITIPDSVVALGSYCFNSCSALKSISFGENSKLKTIERAAFAYCTALTTIWLPKSVTTIDTSYTSTSTNETTQAVFASPFYACVKTLMIYLEAEADAVASLIENGNFGSYWNMYKYTTGLSYETDTTYEDYQTLIADAEV